MKEKRKEIPILTMEPGGRKTSYKITGWTIFLACMFSIGGVLILQKSWSTAAPSIWSTAVVAAVGMLTCILEQWLSRRKYPFTWTARLFPWIILLLWGTPASCLNGAKEWLHLLITRWNFVHNDGTSVFTVNATQREILVISLLAALFLGQAAWRLAESHSRPASIFFCTLLILAGAGGDTFDPAACSFLLIALFGMNMSDAGTMVTKACLRWMIGIGAVLLVGSVFLPGSEIGSIRQMREHTKQAVHELRYGKDSLPEGDLRNAAKLKESEETMLEVAPEQEKALYLRGFVGSTYEDGVWKKTEDSVYGGENSGMLKWLKQKNFDPLMQLSEYYAAGEDDDAPEKNHIEYRIDNASRYYVYLPSSLEEVTAGSLKEQKDIRYVSRGLIGEKNYAVEEVSSSRPSELMVADDWVSDPQTDAQKTYCEAEAVYRQFVYDNYTQADAGLSDLIRETFWEDYQTESDGIYSALTQIRNVLKETVQYTDAPDAAPEGVDPIRYFLSGSHQGNAMLYASTAVEAFRLHGIPARYVEGYYLSETEISDSKDGAVSLSGQDAHAWVEVYFDGIGWLPVDVTPGYYYEAVTLQQMVGTPDAVWKNASLDNNSFDADQLTGSGSAGSKKQEVFRIAKKTMQILLGIVAVFLILMVVLFCLIEVLRVLTGWIVRKKYQQADEEEQVRWIEQIIHCYLGIWGIAAHLGWNTDETDQEIAEKINAVHSGEYRRVCELLEKTIYGEMELEEYEKRTLKRFIKKLAFPEEKCSLKNGCACVMPTLNLLDHKNRNAGEHQKKTENRRNTSMKVIRAKSAGFCFGVKRAVDTVYEQVEKQTEKQIYTYGPIIHNEEVVKDMEAHGVKVLRSEEDLRNLKEGLVIIRSHGVPKRICDLMDEKGMEYVDATCPFVKRIHKIVAEESEKGSRIIIIGNPDHPEVEGIKGWAGENVTIIKNAEEAEKFENATSERICIVAQTTFNYNKFKDLVEIISEKGYDISVLNTICNATRERQTEARSIAKEVDAMIVIGDKHSSNTQKLYEICSRECHNTYYIQTLDDFDMNQLRSVETVGITAGASTPNNIIEEVQNNVRINF